ncbi:nitroreductase family protein, partial [candidate division KSB1 bacterium]|nr:nitroreductase family protein [candidate division KSB1 bacterium]
MHVYDVILNRHSVRKFSDQTIEDSIVEKILNAARLAPSWRNQQCWHFIVVKDKSTKDKIIRCTQYFNQSWLGNEPVIIVFCGDPQQSGFNNQQPYYLVDTAIAYTQMML